MRKNAKKKPGTFSGRGLWGAISPLWPRYHPIWFKTSTLKENCLSNYCGEKKIQKKTNIWPFRPTHTYTKLTLVSFFLDFFFVHLSLRCPVMMVTKVLDNVWKKMDFGPKNSIFGPKICIFLRYTHTTPIFWGQTDPTQWDHNTPTSWGNSG